MGKGRRAKRRMAGERERRERTEVMMKEEEMRGW